MTSVCEIEQRMTYIGNNINSSRNYKDIRSVLEALGAPPDVSHQLFIITEFSGNQKYYPVTIWPDFDLRDNERLLKLWKDYRATRLKAGIPDGWPAHDNGEEFIANYSSHKISMRNLLGLLNDLGNPKKLTDIDSEIFGDSDGYQNYLRHRYGDLPKNMVHFARALRALEKGVYKHFSKI